jgi:hypothetical protein
MTLLVDFFSIYIFLFSLDMTKREKKEQILKKDFSIDNKNGICVSVQFRFKFISFQYLTR